MRQAEAAPTVQAAIAAPPPKPATYHDYIAKYFPAHARQTAEALVLAESGGGANQKGYNTNGTIDYGLFQINSVHRQRVNGDLDRLLDPETNVQVAAQIYAEQGFNPWVAYWTGKYKKYL